MLRLVVYEWTKGCICCVWVGSVDGVVETEFGGLWGWVAGLGSAGGAVRAGLRGAGGVSWVDWVSGGWLAGGAWLAGWAG